MTARASCIACGGANLEEVLDLGMHPFADRFVPRSEASSPDALYALVLDLCVSCGHVQSRTVTSPDDRYRKGYAYTAGNSETTRRFWGAFAEDTVRKLGLGKGAFVLEAGSNDGTLCAAFDALGCSALGVDPSPEMATIALGKGARTVVAYFGEKLVTDHGIEGEADVVVACNVLNHADNLRGFVRAARRALKPGGAFVFQVPSWRAMVQSGNFDQVYHEHVSYFSSRSIAKLAQLEDMHVVEIEEVSFHGTSLRVTLQAGASNAVPEGLARMATAEAELSNPAFYAEVRRRALATRRRTTSRLLAIAASGPLVCAGASAKGNTFLNWHGLSKFDVTFVTDVAPTKVGRLTPGSRIPIEHDATLACLDHPRVLILSWNIADTIRASLLEHNPDAELLDLGQLTEAA